ncbi:MAG: superoxide dismutase [Gammaproteobacteria bacterium]|nr:superoxide dismutase [Gammaproteobacteria bacterium]
MKFELPPLPYAKDALEPHLSAKTLTLHHDKHHRTYLDKLEKAIADTPLAAKSIEEIIQTQHGDVFNNAAQFWNHGFYWQCMSPSGGGEPRGALADAIRRDIGSLDDFKQRLAEAATTQFGSGWAWLAVGADGKLRVFSTTDAETPLANFQIPILTIDMWEHAYYVDYHNEKQKYVSAYLDHLLNWRFAESNYTHWLEIHEAA